MTKVGCDVTTSRCRRSFGTRIATSSGGWQTAGRPDWSVCITWPASNIPTLTGASSRRRTTRDPASRSRDRVGRPRLDRFETAAAALEIRSFFALEHTVVNNDVHNDVK